MDFCIIDVFEKDSYELNFLQNAFRDAPFSPGKMLVSEVDKKTDDLFLDTKNNLEMDRDSVEPGHKYFEHYRKNSYYGRCFDTVKTVIEKHGPLRSHTMMNRNNDFIFSKYLEGGYYHQHVDNQRMGRMRTDYSCTLFINEPEEYEGGELCIDIGTHEVKYKLEAGKAIVYPTGIRHRVDKVTSGERHVCVFWIESALQDVRMRELYRGIDMMVNKYLYEPDAADLISKKGFELQHHIMRHFAQYS
ncbi:2OG-Fe(II) oxygenase [Synechococcus phage S-H9-1]|uniref:2OG-Fe(II) oxygenase n=1 Tax=Synechococcus phage S-H9-1 TaxID=2783674 RepID=A0A873WKB6_9CAUD|nr:2OG-Fe(II) oxygenase [Synechococcus phage S-H9-1]QPB08091.1 2OG-Fe(II) oxygenase [Synechococcus phage S-H9-1]